MLIGFSPSGVTCDASCRNLLDRSQVMAEVCEIGGCYPRYIWLSDGSLVYFQWRDQPHKGMSAFRFDLKDETSVPLQGLSELMHSVPSDSSSIAMSQENIPGIPRLCQ